MPQQLIHTPAGVQRQRRGNKEREVSKEMSVKREGRRGGLVQKEKNNLFERGPAAFGGIANDRVGLANLRDPKRSENNLQFARNGGHSTLS